jgi:hypothetical protein
LAENTRNLRKDICFSPKKVLVQKFLSTGIPKKVYDLIPDFLKQKKKKRREEKRKERDGYQKVTLQIPLHRQFFEQIRMYL